MIKIKDINMPSKIGVTSVAQLMTPKKLLSKSEFDRPFVITPEEFPSFEELLKVRDEIRHLKLVPVKDDPQHDLYNSLNKKELEKTVRSYISDSEITCTDNLYPYWLPKDVKQSLIWVRDETDEVRIYFFISKLLALWELGAGDMILFERPINTKSVLVKGTFPAVRHIHIWTKIKNNGN